VGTDARVAPFPLPAHRTGRARCGHPALRRSSPPSARKRPQMHSSKSENSEFSKYNFIRETRGASPGRLLPSPCDTACSEASGLLPVFPGSSPITSPLLAKPIIRSKGPSLPRPYPASTVLWPSPTPDRAVAHHDHVGGATSTRSGPPPIIQTTFSACRAHSPGGPGPVRVSVPSRSSAAFPVSQAGRRPRHHFQGRLELHSPYGLPVCSPTLRGLCYEASIRSVTQSNRSLAELSR